jgi:dTMP kinase
VFVAFEGIDGSGKTSLSNLVCERLRAAGRAVVHARERGVLASAVARRVRELTRDARLLEMSPRTELFLNLAREVQQLDEIVRPALAAGQLVIADRSLHSLLALAIAGRSLPADEVRPAVAAGSDGTWPDLVVLVEVDPDLARLRKRVGKIVDGRDRDAESRKGLAGAGLQVRIAGHLRAEAERDPARWMVARNEGRPLAALADEVAAEIVVRLGTAGAPRTARPAPAPARARNVAIDLDPAPERIAARFLEAVAGLAGSEPGLAAYLVEGIPGEAEHAVRVGLAPRVPGLVARSLRGLADPAAWALRRTLAAAVPADVAEGLGADPSPEAMALRADLLERAPGPVLAGLARNATQEAWMLRGRGLAPETLEAVLEGLAGIDSPRAWGLRAEGMVRELWVGVGRSLAGVIGAEADAMREAIAARDRLAALRSTAGLDCALARSLRERLFPLAAKRVLRSLTGVDAPYAWALRERALAATKEALDSVDAMDVARAWALREAGVERWPATAVSSLRALARTARGRVVVARALRAAPRSLAVLRNAHAAYSRPEPPAATATVPATAAAVPASRPEEPCPT